MAALLRWENVFTYLGRPVIFPPRVQKIELARWLCCFVGKMCSRTFRMLSAIFSPCALPSNKFYLLEERLLLQKKLIYYKFCNFMSHSYSGMMLID